MELREIVAEVETWPAARRLQLLEEVWEGLSRGPSATTLSDAQRAELLRRLEILERDGATGSSWEEVRGRLLARSP